MAEDKKTTRAVAKKADAEIVVKGAFSLRPGLLILVKNLHILQKMK